MILDARKRGTAAFMLLPSRYQTGKPNKVTFDREGATERRDSLKRLFEVSRGLCSWFDGLLGTLTSVAGLSFRYKAL